MGWSSGRPLGVVAALAALTVAIALWVVSDDDPKGTPAPASIPRDESSSRPPPEPASSAGAERAPGSNRVAIRRTLKRAVGDAAALGGTVEAAALREPWTAPVVVASDPGAGRRQTLMWSMSKVATLVALLRALGWDDVRGESPSEEVQRAIRGAITRSENCRQRRVVLELQELAGGTEQAHRALSAAIRAAGAGASVGEEAAPPEALCLSYLTGQHGLSDPLAPGLLLGTSTWTVADAVRFMDALGNGVYGSSVSRYVLRLMRAPKRRSREAPPGDLTAALDWGAGRAFADREPAYKAGWGGTQRGEFFAGQIALVELPASGSVAVAVMFHPDAQPVRDDPGITAAPEGIELVMRALERRLASTQSEAAGGA